MLEADDSCVVTSTRRKFFADTLKKKGVTRASQLTSAVQIELFDLCATFGGRCAFRRFLTEEYGMTIGNDGILNEKELAAHAAASQTEGVLV